MSHSFQMTIIIWMIKHRNVTKIVSNVVAIGTDVAFTQLVMDRVAKIFSAIIQYQAHPNL